MKSQIDPLLLAMLLAKKMKKKEVNLSKLPRLLSPYFKTTLIADVILTLKLKGTKNKILVQRLEDFFGVVSFRIKCSKKPELDFTIYAETNKELLDKLFNKYPFFT